MAQFLRPASDVDDGEFLPSTGSDHYATIDESSPDDGDYVYATGNGDFTVALSAGTDPVSSSDHVARYRAKGNGVADLRVTLLEDSTPIASWTESAAAATFTNYSHTLSGGEADSITDYTALRFKMEVGDFTAPTLSSPSDGTPTADGADDPSVSTNEGNGTLYWAVLTDGGSCTDAQLKAGSGGDIVAGKAGNQAVSGAGTQTTPDITGLSASTNYEIVFLHRDAAGNDSSQATVGLTTTAGGSLDIGVSGVHADSTAALTLEDLSTTSGRTLVAAIWWGSGAPTFTSMADSNTNTWDQIGTQLDDSGLSMRTYIAHNITGGAGHDFTATFSAQVLVSMVVVEIIGAPTSSANDATSLASTSDASSPFTVTSGTLEQADEVIIAVLAGDSGSNPATLAESTGFDVEQSVTDGSTLWCGGVATKIVSSTSAVTPSFTQSGSSAAILRVFGIKAA